MLKLCIQLSQIGIRELLDSGVTCDKAYKIAKKYVREDANHKSQLVIDYVSCPLAMNWIKEHPISFLKAQQYVLNNFQDDRCCIYRTLIYLLVLA